jgi:hypothetical protein
MQEAKTDDLFKIAFCTHLVGFTRQAIIGIIISSFRHISKEGTFKYTNLDESLTLIRNGTFIFENIINYINTNWTSFNEKSDSYVVEKFNMLMKFGHFRHNSCIFFFVWDFIESVLVYTLGRIGKEDIFSVEILRDSLERILDVKLANVVEEILFEDFSCNNNCESIEYDADICLIDSKKF